MLTKTTMADRAAWLASRSCIGGSDAAAIIGLSPWKTVYQLWQEKTGRVKPDDISDNARVKYGNDAEPLLRELFALDFPSMTVEYEPHNIFRNDLFPWGHASLDGWLTDADGRRGILEIKTSEPFGKAQWALWDERIPENYYCQILHYLMITEWDFAILKGQLKKSDGNVITRHYRFERADVLDDIQYLADCEKRFWLDVQNDTPPESSILPSI